MAKEKTINWIKLQQAFDENIPSLKLIEQWVADNADLQILKRYTITKVSIPKAHQKKAHAAYLVKWRKALQQFKGRWQWREVESYLLIEEGGETATTEPKSSIQSAEAKEQKPAISKPSAKVVTQQPIKVQQMASDSRVKAEPKATPTSKAHPAKNKAPKSGINLESKKAPEHAKGHHSKNMESQNNVAKKRNTSGHNVSDNGKHKTHASLAKVQPVPLHGLEIKQQNLYSRRPLSKN